MLFPTDFPPGATEAEKQEARREIRRQRLKLVEHLPKIDGAKFKLKGKFTLIPITDLLRRTGTPAHVAFHDSYGEIVIFMDREVYDAREDKQTLLGQVASTANNHELRTIALYMEAVYDRRLDGDPITGIDL